MTQKTKRVLFYSAVAVFFLMSYVVILYAEGYKYSFSQNRFFRTGAIYLGANTGADVYLNDKYDGSTSFIGNSYRINGLLPGHYTVRVQKDNYFSWRKMITVDEGLVSEFSKILLVPNQGPEKDALVQEIDDLIKLSSPSAQKIFILKRGVLYQGTDTTPVKIDSGVKGFELSESQNRLVWWNQNELWVMWLNDTGYQPYHKKGDKALITRFPSPIKKAAWFRGDDHLVVDAPSANSGQAGYKILEIDTRGSINIIQL